MSLNLTFVGAKTLDQARFRKALEPHTAVIPAAFTNKMNASISQLLTEVDEYQKLLIQGGAFLSKIEKLIYEIVPEQLHKLQDGSLWKKYLREVSSKPFQLEQLDGFKAKLSDISKQFTKLQSDYQQTASALSNYDNSHHGTIQMKSANKLIGHNLVKSEYLTNVVLIINKQQLHELTALAQKEDNDIVPNSVQICEEEEVSVAVALLCLTKSLQQVQSLFRTNKYYIKEFDSTYVEDDEGALLALKKKNQDATSALTDFLMVNQEEILKLIMQIQVHRCVTETQLRFGAQYQVLGLLSENKNPRMQIKDLIDVPEEQEAYDQDYDQEGSFLPVVITGLDFALIQQKRK